MWYYAIKVLISAVLIVLISEVSKRSSIFGALVASLPLVSLLAIFWLYWDTGSIEKVSALAKSIFWLVLPSLVFFIILPVLLHYKLNFYFAMLMAIICTIIAYGVLFFMLSQLNII